MLVAKHDTIDIDGNKFSSVVTRGLYINVTQNHSCRVTMGNEHSNLCGHHILSIGTFSNEFGQKVCMTRLEPDELLQRPSGAKWLTNFR